MAAKPPKKIYNNNNNIIYLYSAYSLKVHKRFTKLKTSTLA